MVTGPFISYNKFFVNINGKHMAYFEIPKRFPRNILYYYAETYTKCSKVSRIATMCTSGRTT
jgi:hypothetical protein